MAEGEQAATGTVSEQEVSEFREIFNLVDRVSIITMRKPVAYTTFCRLLIPGWWRYN
jgi:hypothetical protein